MYTWTTVVPRGSPRSQLPALISLKHRAYTEKSTRAALGRKFKWERSGKSLQIKKKKKISTFPLCVWRNQVFLITSLSVAEVFELGPRTLHCWSQKPRSEALADTPMSFSKPIRRWWKCCLYFELRWRLLMPRGVHIRGMPSAVWVFGRERGSVCWRVGGWPSLSDSLIFRHRTRPDDSSNRTESAVWSG